MLQVTESYVFIFTQKKMLDMIKFDDDRSIIGASNVYSIQNNLTKKEYTNKSTHMN